MTSQPLPFVQSNQLVERPGSDGGSSVYLVEEIRDSVKYAVMRVRPPGPSRASPRHLHRKKIFFFLLGQRVSSDDISASRHAALWLIRQRLGLRPAVPSA